MTVHDSAYFRQALVLPGLSDQIKHVGMRQDHRGYPMTLAFSLRHRLCGMIRWPSRCD